MTDIVSNFDKIQKEDVDFRSVDAEPLFQKIAGSINLLIDLYQDDFAVGDIVPTGLTLSEFTSQVSGTWVEMQGQSIVGSDLTSIYLVSTAPDHRGMFQRGADNGRGIDTGRVLNSTQGSFNKVHEHYMINSNPANNSTASIGGSTPFVGTAGYRVSGSGDPTEDILSIGADSANKPNRQTFSTGLIEARPENIKINYYLKTSY